MSKAFSKQDNSGGAFAEAMHRAVDGERRSKEDRAARYQQSLGTSLPKRALSADGRSLTYVAKAEMSGFWGRAD